MKLFSRRLLIGVFVIMVVAFVAQRLASPPEETRIRRVVEAVATSDEPALCARAMTARYLTQRTGAAPRFAAQTCKREPPSPRARSVKVEDTAITGKRATVVVRNKGGSLDGSSLLLGLIEAEGRWKVDRLIRFVRLDRDGFDRGYRRLLTGFGSPPQAIACAMAREHELSNADLEQVLLKGGRRTFSRIVVACDRDGVEQTMVEGIHSPQLALPEAAASCASHRVQSANDLRDRRLSPPAASRPRGTRLRRAPLQAAARPLPELSCTKRTRAKNSVCLFFAKGD